MGVYIPYKRLPSAYQEVEYIQSSGTQYIDTGYKPTNTIKVVVEMGGWTASVAKNGAVFGSWDLWSSTSANGFTLGYNKQNNNYTAMFGKGYGSSSYINRGIIDAGTHIIEQSQNGIYVDNEQKLTFDTYTFSCPVNMYIFAINDNGATTEFASYNLYKFKIYNGSTLVRDFIPCYRKQDGVIGLYDLVNSVFYTNSGTGTFSKGNDVTMAELKNAYIGEVWTPKDPYCWYEFNGDYKDNTGLFGNATGTSTFATLTSGQKVLQTDGTNNVLLPSGVTSSAITTYTIAFWMKILTTSPTYGYYAGCGSSGNNPSMAFYESTSGRNYYEWTNASSSTKNNIDTTVSGMTTGWRLVIIRSNGTNRASVKMKINDGTDVSPTGTSGADSSSIFGRNQQFAIGSRYATGNVSGQITSIQISNFVISHSYWSDTELQRMYDGTKSLYGIN